MSAPPAANARDQALTGTRSFSAKRLIPDASAAAYWSGQTEYSIIGKYGIPSSITAPVPLVDTDQDSPFDHIETGLPWPPRDIANGSRVEDSGDAAIEELASDEYELDEDARAEQELDALIDGRKRPHHLID